MLFEVTLGSLAIYFRRQSTNADSELMPSSWSVNTITKRIEALLEDFVKTVRKNREASIECHRRMVQIQEEINRKRCADTLLSRRQSVLRLIRYWSIVP
jgi:hypothetical protein